MQKQENTNNQTKESRNKVGFYAGVLGIVLNFALSGSKILVGTMVASVSMVADGFNNLADIASNVASMIGFHLAKKPADKEHPFGHARFEYISGLVISMLIFFASLSLFWESLVGIFQGKSGEFSSVAIWVLLASVAVKVFMGIFNWTLSKKINSKTLKAVAVDSFSDCLATSGVIVCMALKLVMDFNLDGYMGCVVSILIFLSGLNVLKNVLSSLLGERITLEQAKEIESIICGYAGVLGIHDLIMHSYGEGNVYASSHVEMNASIPPLESHDIIDTIERDFSQMGIHMVLHYDPVETDNAETNRLKALVVEILQGMEYGLKMHDFRAVHSASHINLVFDLVVPYEYRMSREDILHHLEREIAKVEDNIFLVVDFDQEF